MGFAPNQLAEAKTLADFVEREQRSPYFVVVGDFNSLPGSPVDRYLREERGLVDAFSEVQRFSEAEARAYPTAGFLNLRMHLDHVYSSRQLWSGSTSPTPTPSARTAPSPGSATTCR